MNREQEFRDFETIYDIWWDLGNHYLDEEGDSKPGSGLDGVPEDDIRELLVHSNEILEKCGLTRSRTQTE